MTNGPEKEKHPIPSELVQEDESFAEIVEEFVEGLQRRLDEIGAAARAQDFAHLRDLAHQLKGSAGGYGYPLLTRKAAEMELHALGGELEAVQADLTALQEMILRVVVRS